MVKRVVYDKTTNKNAIFVVAVIICRQCPIEAQMAPILKYIGKIIENFMASQFACPCCNKNGLTVLEIIHPR